MTMEWPEKFDCIFEAGLAVAYERAQVVPFDSETERLKVLGGIVETTIELRLLREKFPCPKVDGSATCPLKDQALQTRGLAITRWLDANYAANLAEIGKDHIVKEKANCGSVGQYL